MSVWNPGHVDKQDTENHSFDTQDHNSLTDRNRSIQVLRMGRLCSDITFTHLAGAFIQSDLLLNTSQKKEKDILLSEEQ